jgi:hypothetical protein
MNILIQNLLQKGDEKEPKPKMTLKILMLLIR